MEKLIIKEKLPKAFKNKWIKALRSGKYKQGNGSLYNKKDDSYCCLGLGAAICGISLESLEGKGLLINNAEKKIRGINKIPKPLIGSVLKISNKYNPIVDKLVDMNDNMMNMKHKYSFKRIATWIEKHL